MERELLIIKRILEVLGCVGGAEMMNEAVLRDAVRLSFPNVTQDDFLRAIWAAERNGWVKGLSTAWGRKWMVTDLGKMQ
jgi:hypothetical protein